MSLQDNKALSQRLNEAFNAHDLEAFDTLMVPELAARWKQDYADTLATFPDFSGEVLEQIAEGDTIVTRWVGHGTQRGEFLGIPPTGKQLTWPGLRVDRIEGGKFVAVDSLVDGVDILRQLGWEPRVPAGAGR